MLIPLQIALIGDPSELHTDHLDVGELYRPYSQRQSTNLEVDESAQLSAVLADAGERFKLRSWQANPTHIGFFRPEDETSEAPVFSLWVPTINEAGVARWSPPPHNFPVADVRRASANGFLYGDPQRIHIALVPPVGDGVLPDWQTLAHVLDVLQAVAEILVLPGGLAASWKLLKRRTRDNAKDAAAAIRSHSPSWQGRGADPYVFDQWLSLDPPFHPRLR